MPFRNKKLIVLYRWKKALVSGKKITGLVFLNHNSKTILVQFSN